MNADRSRRIEEAFKLALQCEPAGRPALLDRLCCGDAELRAEVEGLLDADERASRGRFLTLPEPPESAGEGERFTCLHLRGLESHLRCPHCRNLIEQVGPPEGEVVCPACGSTFRLKVESTAPWGMRGDRRQFGPYELIDRLGIGTFGTVYKARDPRLDRTVAIKIPRAGNLATGEDRDRFLREARSAAQLRHPAIMPVHEVGEHEGTPYLVSDFVRGVTLADLLTARRPAPREAARLLAAVADALHFAHERGIVHRDVKPSNIMIDDAGQPHVMDFGLAKRDAGEVTMTLDGCVLGTPAYISPEQARGEGHRADRGSDVYSLGVVLYELLTGELPFRGNDRMLLHQALNDEPKPPRKLNDRIPRDLETICLKCLEKDPRRRYASAEALAADLERWLAGEPILARPVGQAARLRLWCRRKPALAGLLVALTLSVTGGLAGIIWKWREAEHQRQLARAEAVKAQATLSLFQDVLAQAAPELNRREHKITVEEVLDRVAEKADTAFAGQAEVETAVRTTLGATYHSLGNYPKAQRQLERTLAILRSTPGPVHRDSIKTMNLLCWVYYAQGDWERCQAFSDQALALCRTATGPDGLEALHAMHFSALMLLNQNKVAEALGLFEKVLRSRRRVLGRDNPDTLRTMEGVATALKYLGRYEQAQTVAQEMVERSQSALKPEHPQTLWRMRDLAEILWLRGNRKAARDLFERVLETRRHVQGPEHLFVANDLWRYGVHLWADGRAAEAEPRFREAVRIGQKCLPQNSPWIGVGNTHLGGALVDLGRTREAELLLRKGLAILREARPKAHWRTMVALAENQLGGCLAALGHGEEAEQLLKDSYRTIRDAPDLPPGLRAHRHEPVGQMARQAAPGR